MARARGPVPQATQTRCVMVPSMLSRLQTRASAKALGSSTGRQVKARPQSSKEKSRPWREGECGEGEATGRERVRGGSVTEGCQAGLQVGSHRVENEDAGFPQDVGGHHLGGQSRGHSAGTGQPPPPYSPTAPSLPGPPGPVPPRSSRPGRGGPLTVQPARALRCSAATSKALRVAPPLPRRAQGSSTARRSGGGRGPRLPLSRRASSSAKREAGGAEGWHPAPRRGERASASPAACLAGRRRRSRRAGR